MVDVARQGGQQVQPVRQSRSEVSRPTVVAGTSKGLWIMGSEQQTELEGSAITAIAHSESELWVIARRNSVWHRDLNREWHKVASISNLRLNCLLSFNQTIWVGASEAHLFQVVADSLQTIDGFEQAEGRDEWYTPWGGPPDVRSLAVGTSSELYVNIHVGGILRSLDQGQTWQPTLDIHADVHEVKTLPTRPGLVLAATAEGLAISLDGGDSWSFDRTNLHATYARAVAVCGNTLLMSVSIGPRGNQAALYRRHLDQPGTFEKCDRGLPDWFSDNINTGCLAALEDVVAFGTSDGQIFLSNDTGITWERLAAGLAPIHALSLV